MFPKNSFALVSYLIFNNILIFWQRKSQRFVFRCHFDENSVKILQNLAIWVIWIHICDCGRYESRRLVILPLVGVGERKRVSWLWIFDSVRNGLVLVSNFAPCNKNIFWLVVSYQRVCIWRNFLLFQSCEGLFESLAGHSKNRHDFESLFGKN